MEKYLGNKRLMLDALFGFTTSYCPGASSLCDPFSGTTNVARYFRRRGYSVYANDINRFSWVLGTTYLSTVRHPTFEKVDVPAATRDQLDALMHHFDKLVFRDRDQLFSLREETRHWDAMQPAARVLAYLNHTPIDTSKGPGLIEENFCASGSKSDYLSARGTHVHRNYFSPANARRLDFILDALRQWWRDGMLSKAELAFLLTTVIEEITLIANVSGTFHDFNRKRLWPNALQPLTLRLPLVDTGGPAGTMFCQDANLLVPQVAEHDILYLDPPYNFRQYTAYYHLLNFVSAFPFLEDVDGYLDAITWVRGQHPEDDFTSVFCARDKFADAIVALIENARAEYVVMSYYGGRNHWNHWDKTQETTDDGFRVFDEIFSNRALFDDSTSVPVLGIRKNFQSRGGEQKTLVDEHLFWGRRRHAPRPPAARTDLISAVNQRFGLTQFRP